MRLSLFLLFIIPFTASALETDNYLSWNRDLEDSQRHIDRFFAEEINQALHKIKDHSNNCEEMTILIAREFESRLVHDNPVENWLFKKISHLRRCTPETSIT